MANREKKTIVTRKHLARLERENIQKRYITIITLALVAAVVIITAVGFILEGVIKPRQPIAQVNDSTITIGDFQSWTRYNRYLLVTEFLNTYQYIQSFGDPNALSYFESYLIQIQTELEPEFLGFSIIEDMVEDVIIQEEAEKLGIQVSAAEVGNRIDALIFEYYPEGTPTPAPTTEVWATPTLSALQMVLVPPTPTVAITTTEELEPTPPEAVSEPTAILPTPTDYTEKAYNSSSKDFMSYIKSYANVSEEDIFKYYQAQMLRTRVAEAIITDIPAETEVLWAHHILFRDQDTGELQSEEFLERIGTGEAFISVAGDLSSLPDDSTEEAPIVFEDLGWFGEGQMVAPFADAASKLEIGEISQPVNTSFGWHVIQLLGRDTQLRSQAEINQLRMEAFQDWLNLKRLEINVDINPDWISAVPTDPDIPEQLKIQLPE